MVEVGKSCPCPCLEGIWGGRGGGVTPLIFHLSIGGRWVVNFTPRPLYLQRKNPCTHSIGGCESPTACPEILKKNSRTCRESNCGQSSPWPVPTHDCQGHILPDINTAFLCRSLRVWRKHFPLVTCSWAAKRKVRGNGLLGVLVEFSKSVSDWTPRNVIT